jgi:enoyl-CoA hydratase/carnithine racemase
VNSNLPRIEKQDTFTRVTLSRADKANALDDAAVGALQLALDTAYRDGTALLVIAGEGKNFCAGFDLSNLVAETDATLIARLQRAEMLLQSIYYAPFATVALIQGGAYGAGFDLAMACDYRVAAPDATLRMPSWKMGIAIGSRRLASRVGTETAFQCLRSAAVLNANAALADKFITEIADPVTWSRRVEEIAAEVHALPTGAYSQLKRMLIADTRDADMQSLMESLEREPLKARMMRYVDAARLGTLAKSTSM